MKSTAILVEICLISFEAGEMTAEEVYAELNKVEGVVFSGPPRRNLPEKTIEEIEEIKREFNIK